MGWRSRRRRDYARNPASLRRPTASAKLLSLQGEKEFVRMASKGQMTGMLGVYLAAAELTSRGFIVSPTSRSAIGADLLVTDQECRRAWSIQVKTNRKAARFWLIGQHNGRFKSKSHVYIFINLKGDERPDYLVVASAFVAMHARTSH